MLFIKKYPSKSSLKITRNLCNVPALPNNKKSHLSRAIQTNKIVNEKAKYLSKYSNTKSTNYDIKLNINHSCSIEKDNGKRIFNIELDAVTPIVKPCTFVCILDISGSMSTSSSYRNDPEASQFSRMDLVKHSVNTIIHCLRPEDTLSIVAFNGRASKILTFTNMDESGKKLATYSLNQINENGGTNLWDGLSRSMDELYDLGVRENHNNFLVLLTDGEPNENPPRGIYNEFMSKIATSPLIGNLHTIGYGYDLDSVLLSNLAKDGNGLFAHVPDYSMCNTVFINLLGNCLATAISNVTMKITSIKGFAAINLYNSINKNNCINVGPIQSGQQQNVIFEAEINLSDFELCLEFTYDGKTIYYKINTLDSKSKNTNTKDILNFANLHTRDADYWKMHINDIFASSDTVYQVFKTMLCDIIKRGLLNSHKSGESQKICIELDNLYKFIEQIQTVATKQSDKNKLEALLNNIKNADVNLGQVYKAFSNEEWLHRWGVHYLKYFNRSHELQICSNYKDSSLQLYGGELFRELRTEIEDIFSTIPIPQPSRSSTPFTGNFQQTFYTASGPCFNGNGLVRMADRPDVRVKDIRKGHLILNSDGNIATVVCVIKTIIKHGTVSMVLLDNLRVTPYHPIKHNGKWVHPCTIKEPIVVHCDAIYNFVLDKHHIITINNTDGITLGHGVTDDPILAHPFFGTSLVIDNLKTDKGWENGFIEIVNYKPSFDAKGLISSFFDVSNYENE